MLENCRKISSLALGLGLSSLMAFSAYGESLKMDTVSSFFLSGSAKITVERSLSPIEPVRSIEIDNQTRIIGGSGSLSEHEPAIRSAQKFLFAISPDEINDHLLLTIGYIRGVNTLEAHQAGQSHVSFISSPAVIKVNGVRLYYVYTDEDLLRIAIPKSMLRADGYNVLQVEAGFYFLPGNRIAYDTVELKHLALSF